MAGNDNLRTRAHADCIGPDDLKQAKFCTCLKRRTADHRVRPLVPGETRLGRMSAGDRTEGRGVGIHYRGEAFTNRVVVWPAERVVAGHARQKDVVGDQHDVTGRVG